MNNTTPSYSVFPNSAKIKAQRTITAATGRPGNTTSSDSSIRFLDPPLTSELSTIVLDRENSDRRLFSPSPNKGKKNQTKTYHTPHDQNFIHTSRTDYEIVSKPSFDPLDGSRCSQDDLAASNTIMRDRSLGTTPSQFYDMNNITRQSSLEQNFRLQRNYLERRSSGSETGPAESIHKKTYSSNGDILENILGIYPEKKKFGVGVSVADVVANKLFRRSHKTNVPFAAPAVSTASDNTNLRSNGEHPSRRPSSSDESIRDMSEVPMSESPLINLINHLGIMTNSN